MSSGARIVVGIIGAINAFAGIGYLTKASRGVVEGASCSGAVGACDGARAAFFCVADRYARRGCLGPRGCSARGSRIDCDESVSPIGGPCAGAGGACTPDGSKLLTCVGTSLQVAAECIGPAHCTTVTTPTQNTSQIHCDQPRVTQAYPCHIEGDAECGTDARAYRCVRGAYVPFLTCGGPDGCHEDAQGQPQCDRSVWAVGELCNEVGGKCSADGAQLLTCEQGHVVARETCASPSRCITAGTRVGCSAVAAAADDDGGRRRRRHRRH